MNQLPIMLLFNDNLLYFSNNKNNINITTIL